LAGGIVGNTLKNQTARPFSAPFAELATGNAPFTPVLKSSISPFLEYLKPNDGFPMPDAEVVPVFEVDGLTNRYDTPIFTEKCGLKT
jgi:hypothetical protein